MRKISLCLPVVRQILYASAPEDTIIGFLDAVEEKQTCADAVASELTDGELTSLAPFGSTFYTPAGTGYGGFIRVDYDGFYHGAITDPSGQSTLVEGTCESI